jgi:hypothetical protein
MTADFGFNDGTTRDRVPKEHLDAVREWTKREMKAGGLQNYLLYAKKTTAVPGKQSKKRKPTEDDENRNAGGGSEQRPEPNNQLGYQGAMPDVDFDDDPDDIESRLAGRSRSPSPDVDERKRRRV